MLRLVECPLLLGWTDSSHELMKAGSYHMIFGLGVYMGFYPDQENNVHMKWQPGPVRAV